MNRITLLVLLICLASSRIGHSQHINPAELLITLNSAEAADTTRILAKTELAYCYYAINSDSTLLLANQAIHESKKINFQKGLGRGYWIMGVYHSNLGEPFKAVCYYDTALSYVNPASDKFGMGRLYNGLGQVEASFGNFEKALKYHFQSLKIKEHQNDSSGIATSDNNIGNIYFKLGNNDKALYYCFRSLALRKSMNDIQGIAASENNIALIYDKIGQRDKALEYFINALMAFRITGNQRGLTYVSNDIAKVYLRQKDFKLAYEHLSEGLITAERMNSKERIADLNVSMAKYFNTVGQYNEAQLHADKALRISRESGVREVARASFHELAFAASHSGRYKDAFQFQLQYTELNDSLLSEMKMERAFQEEFKFKDEKLKLEQEKKDLLYKAKAERQNWLLYGTLLALSGVAVVAYSFYKSFTIKKKSSELLTAQKNELAKKNAVIEDQNRLLQEAKTHLELKIEKRTQDLKIANEELVNQNVQLDQFTFMTAHNLRGPVARLMGLSSLYDFSKPEEPFNAEVVRRMQQSSTDLDEVIRDMTLILRTKSGMGDTFSIVTFTDALNKALYQLDHELKESSIEIKNELEGDLSTSGIMPYIQSIFYNVISNSIKYCEGCHQPEIRIWAQQHEHNTKIHIADNGIGFNTNDHREKLFRPFTRFSTVKEGKGLGLYLIKIQMEAMRGAVEIESKLNHGTTVTLSFPLNLTFNQSI